MCCHDLDGILLWINPAAARSLGYTEEEAIGTRLDKYLAVQARSLFDSYLERIRRTGSDNGLMRLRAKNGDERVWMYRNVISEDPELPPHVLGHAIDITEQFRIQKALRDSFQQTPIGQLEIDADGKLLRINSAACEILGHSELELLFASEPLPAHDFFREMAVGMESPRLVIFTRNDGRVLHLEVHVRRLEGTASSPGGVACALMDVSERVRAETKIRNLNAQLEARVAARTAELRQSNAELREFAYIASHDLQAPLKQAGRTLEKLTPRISDREACALLERTQADIQRMSMLVESLLSYAVYSNRTEVTASRVPLTVAVEESLMNLASSISASQAVVSYENLPNLMVNESEFVQLFQNLIGNALKYRSKEPPRISISAIDANNFWTISVEDNGIGIDPMYSERIFEAFRRLHGKEYAGSGMGLAICKKIVERTGGRIWVESEPGKGSTFRFTIPLEPALPGKISF